ncbi:MAG: class I SAM-dependent methyltransferase, partial [Bacteroidia bacterium]|nr:class I SAM-dependent methyltransferase [Bacteroidia bacterium]
MDKRVKQSIRKRVNPKPWDFSYLITKENAKTFSYMLNYLEKKQQLKIIELGCGYKPFYHVFKEKFTDFEYIGVDISREKSSADILLDLNKDLLPYEDNTFDLVIMSEVLEHLYNPLHALKEAVRVCKEGGLFYISTPFVFPYHGTPHDYFRYTEFFYIHISKLFNLEIILCRKACSFFSTPFLTVAILINIIFEKLNLDFLSPLFLTPINTLAVMLDKITLGLIKIFKLRDIESRIQFMNAGISLIFLKRKNKNSNE